MKLTPQERERKNYIDGTSQNLMWDEETDQFLSKIEDDLNLNFSVKGLHRAIELIKTEKSNNLLIAVRTLEDCIADIGCQESEVHNVVSQVRDYREELVEKYSEAA
jgi:hypothetical protein